MLNSDGNLAILMCNNAIARGAAHEDALLLLGNQHEHQSAGDSKMLLSLVGNLDMTHR